MAKVTHIGGAASATEFTAPSGTVFLLKILNGYELMNVDSLAMGQDGGMQFMRMPYVRALASVVGIKDGEKTLPFGPIRTEIDLQKWGESISGPDMAELMSECGKHYSSGKPELVKNS
jgi:hypothetical protein